MNPPLPEGQEAVEEIADQQQCEDEVPEAQEGSEGHPDVGGPREEDKSVRLVSGKEMLLYMRQKTRSKEKSMCEGSQTPKKAKANQKQSQAEKSVKTQSTRKAKQKIIIAKGSEVEQINTKVGSKLVNCIDLKYKRKTTQQSSIVSSLKPRKTRLTTEEENLQTGTSQCKVQEGS